MRIVSLVPSLTHLLADLGLKDQIVGCTQFCIDPPDLHRTAKLCGGTKNPDIDKIHALSPTHILVNEEENKPEHIELLRSVAPVLNTFPRAPDDVPDLIANVCQFLGIEDDNRLAVQVNELLDEVRQLAKVLPKRKILYFIWKNPWMVVARDTYISRFLALLSMENVVTGDNRYPEVSLPPEGMAPDLIFFSSEPYPFRKRDLKDLSVAWPEHPDVVKADGMLCSWYGSKLLEALGEAKKYCRGEPQELIVALM